MNPSPTTHVATTAVGGAIATIIVWILSLSGLEMDGAVGAAIATVAAFLLGYVVPHDIGGDHRDVP